MKVVNPLPFVVMKVLAFKSAKPKSTKKGKGVTMGTLEVSADIIPYGEDLSPIGSIVLEKSSPSFVRTRPTRRSTAASKTRGSKRKTSSPTSSTSSKRRVRYL